MFWKTWFKKTNVKEEKFSRTFQLLESIDENRLKSVYSSDMSIFKISVYVNNIIDYTHLLNRLSDSFENDNLLSPNLLPQEVVVIYLRDFFLDSKRCYLDTVTVFNIFKESIIRFLQLYDALEQQKGKSFIAEKNLLYTQQYVGNILSLIKELSYG